MSESHSDKQPMELKVSANSAPIDTCKKEAMQTACHKDIPESPWDPSRLLIFDKKIDLEMFDRVKMWNQRSAWRNKTQPNDIIIPDPTPEFVQDAFLHIAPKLSPVLQKDSVQCFLRLLVGSRDAMAWNYSITSETLTNMVSHNALRCAKVVLEGKKPDLNCLHANPNCMNPYGYFALHEAAERFSVDMIKLLFRHGASANVRTIRGYVIEDLLPLHVAVENTCMHKYLEDNLSPIQYHRDYIYKLIYLLCLPEMKIFLDTIRLLAEKTYNLVDEIWNYIKNRKLIHTSLLLLAAQKQIRNHDLFNTIMYRIFRDSAALRIDIGDNGEARKQLEETFHLVSIISHAGDALDKYIQTHSEVPHVEVLEHVSSILQEFGFSPNRDCIDVRNLHSYNYPISFRGLHDKGLEHPTKEITEMSCLDAALEKGVRKKVTGGWDPTYTRRNFFPFRRSILRALFTVRVYSSYASAEDKTVLELRHNRMSNGPSIPNHIALSGRFQQLTSTNQSRKYTTGAFKTLAKLLKNA